MGSVEELGAEVKPQPRYQCTTEQAQGVEWPSLIFPVKFLKGLNIHRIYLNKNKAVEDAE